MSSVKFMSRAYTDLGNIFENNDVHKDVCGLWLRARDHVCVNFESCRPEADELLPWWAWAYIFFGTVCVCFLCQTKLCD
eukprot:COSAG02_NODE_18235_length_952_cov_1.141852_1_plen_79_part_00